MADPGYPSCSTLDVVMIVVVNTIPCLAEVLRQHDEVMSVPYTLVTNDLLRNTGCTALFVRTTTKITESLLHDTSVRFIGTATSGVDHVSVPYLQQHNIVLASAAGSNANAVAEWVLYCTLARARERNQSVAGLTFGLIGFGHIGKLVAAYMSALGMRVIVNDPPLEQQGFKLPDALGSFVSLAQLVEEADVISNHVPYLREGPYATHRLLNIEVLGKTRQGVHIVHSSRGGIVDEEALFALMNDRDADVSVDVWNNEPEYSLVLARAARLASPHISGHSEDGILDAAQRLVQAFSHHNSKDYSSSCFEQQRSTSPARFDAGLGEDAITRVLESALSLEDKHEALRHPHSETAAGRHEHFLELRFSYKGRREVFERPLFPTLTL